MRTVLFVIRGFPRRATCARPIDQRSHRLIYTHEHSKMGYRWKGTYRRSVFQPAPAERPPRPLLSPRAHRCSKSPHPIPPGVAPRGRAYRSVGGQRAWGVGTRKASVRYAHVASACRTARRSVKHTTAVDACPRVWFSTQLGYCTS